jgi:hypothetical protein
MLRRRHVTPVWSDGGSKMKPHDFILQSRGAAVLMTSGGSYAAVTPRRHDLVEARAAHGFSGRGLPHVDFWLRCRRHGQSGRVCFAQSRPQHGATTAANVT